MASDDIPTLETFTEGDTVAVVYATVVDRNGDPIPLAGKTLTLEGRRRGAAAAFAAVAVTVTDSAAAEIEADVADELCDEAGEYRCQFKIATTATPADFYRTDPFKIPVRSAVKDGLS